MWNDKLFATILLAMLVLYFTRRCSSKLDLQHDLESNSRYRSNETFFPWKGFNGRRKNLPLNKSSQQVSCTEAEYEDDKLCGGLHMMTFTCLDRTTEKKTFEQAKSICRAKGMHLPEVLNKRDFWELQQNKFGHYVRMWIGLRRNQHGSFVWQHSNRVVTWTKWQPNQPDSHYGGEDCIEQYIEGWNDMYCASRRHFICAGQTLDLANERIPPVDISLHPEGTQVLKKGVNLTFTCTAYKYRFETLHLLVKYQSGEEQRFSKTNRDCDPLTCEKTLINSYSRNNAGRCVKKTEIKVIFPMSENLARAVWKCQLWNIGDFHNSSEIIGPDIYYASAELVFDVFTNNGEISDGTLLQWTCHNHLGHGDIGSMAVISDYSCGDWVLIANVNSVRKLEMVKNSKCTVVSSVEKIPFENNQGHNLLNIRGEINVTGDLEGAIIACFSYDVRPKWNAGTLLDPADPLAAYSVPIRVIEHKARQPRLTVNYHAKPSTAYRNFDLTAFCDANVGDGGNIIWTLMKKTGETNSTTNLTTPDIRVDQHPNNASCPGGWTRNLIHETCVKTLDDSYSWEDAQLQCQRLGSDLAQIFHPYGLTFLNNILDNDGYWIGLPNLDGDGRITWGSDIDREMMLNGSDWVRVNTREMEPGVPHCVCMYKKSFHKHGCVYKLRPVCEILPPPGVPLYGEFLDIEIGLKMRSVLTIKIDDSLKGATLACQVIGPTVDDEDYFKVESQPFTIKYGNTEANYIVDWETKDHTNIAHIKCSANVGTDGVLSIAIYSEARIKYLYILNLTKQVNQVLPSPDFTDLDITVTSTTKDGPAITVAATVVPTETIYSPYAMCLSHRIQPNDTFDVVAYHVLQRNRRLYVPSFNVRPLIVIVSLLILALLSFLASTKRRKDVFVASEASVHGKAAK